VLAVIAAATLTACSGITPGAAPADEPQISAIDLATGDQVEPVEVAVDGGAAGVG